MSIEIRPLREGELRTWFEAVELAFGDHLTDAQFEANARIFEPDRVLVAADAEQVVGGGAAFTYQLTVPGGEVGAAGVTAVGILPSHRRQGALTALMRRQLTDVRARGEPVAILWASEGGIYQRFGYGLATIRSSIEVSTARSAFRDRHERSGTFRYLTPEQARVQLPPIHERVRPLTPGFLSRHEAWWQVEVIDDPEWSRRGAGPKSFLLHEVDGSAEGYLIYRVRSEWENGVSRSAVEVQELIATTPRAMRDLWRFCLDHDLIASVRARFQPADHPLLLTMAEPRRLQLTLGDGLWLRIVDVPAALAARRYPVADRLVLQIEDPFLPGSAGRWLLDTTSQPARVTPTGDAPDLVLDTTDLATLYLGGSMSQLLAAGRGTEATPGVALRANALFGWSVAPWCPEVF